MHKNALESMKYNNCISSLIKWFTASYPRKKNKGMSMVAPKLSCLLELRGDFWILSLAYRIRVVGGRSKECVLKQISQLASKHSSLGSAGPLYLGTIGTEEAYFWSLAFYLYCSAAVAKSLEIAIGDVSGKATWYVAGFFSLL